MKIGLLPLYVKLYDDKVPQMRPRLEAFYETVARSFETRGVEVQRSPFCRLKDEFRKSVQSFEAASADAIVTLHMAYSPSLESIDALCATPLPIVVLDTTETLEFTGSQDPDEINYCHGIHGVMDMCSMLTRRGKDYAIAAGHAASSDCIDRVCGLVRACVAAKALGQAQVGLVGGAFAGMGDFQVPAAELKERFGIRTREPKPGQLSALYDEVTDAQIRAEMEENAAKYTLEGPRDEEEYTAAVRSCLALRRFVEDEKLTAFSVNFTQMGRNLSGLESMPFLECCKAMERGVGYAGEGDVLTAAFVGAYLQGWPETTFVEIFCPDWKNNTVFLSHMGEMNYRIAALRPCIKRVGVNYSPGRFPYVGYTRMKSGEGVYVNISRGRDNYRLVIAPAQMLDMPADVFTGSMRGWMRPKTASCAEFLEKLSRNGATHHSAFLYGARTEELLWFARLLGLDTAVL